MFDFLDFDEDLEVASKPSNEVDRKRKLEEFYDKYVKNVELDKKKSRTELFCPPQTLELKSLDIEDCLHEVIYPKTYEYMELKPLLVVSAHKFIFKLDPFQRQAIQCIENNQSVLVAAHTSAGKTVTATYTIAQCLKNKCRVVYTTPIKALSNQKYRDFNEEFGDVGLLTGDVTINEEANILVMTTEILRLMFYRNSPIIKEVGWIIFDEIHYMRDRSRGFIWEESIIQLFDSQRMLFLSATIPNARQFAQWISYIHKQPCNVIYTEYRPTPLRHYVYNGSDNYGELVVNDKGEFDDNKLNAALDAVVKMQQNHKIKNEEHIDESIKNILVKINEKEELPVIIFSFSRQQCNNLAKKIYRYNIFNGNHELVETVFDNAIKTLPLEDQDLPQLSEMKQFLKRGIGIHHGGLLPILKEIVEILFGEGLLKVLFATETFAMGLNMPAKTVIFTSLTKFDGDQNRTLSSSEYIQMAGRAGRRGIDKFGNIIMLTNESDKKEDVLHLLKSEAEPLNSSFHITYNMILNLFAVDTITPEYLMERSFLQFQAYSMLPDLNEKMKLYSIELQEHNIDSETEKLVESYVELKNYLKSKMENLWEYIRTPQRYLSVLQRGHMVHVKTESTDFGWCFVASKLTEQNVVTCLVPVKSQYENVSHLSLAVPARESDNQSYYACINVDLTNIYEIGEIEHERKIDEKVCHYLLDDSFARRKFMKSIDFDKIQTLDIRSHFKVHQKALKVYYKKFINEYQEKFDNHAFKNHNNQQELLNFYEKQKSLKLKMKLVQDEIDKRVSVIKMEDLHSRVAVLKKLKYCDKNCILSLKGWIASRISTGDEIILTEMLLNGELNDLDNKFLVSFLSVFVFQDKTKEIQLIGDATKKINRLREQTAYISRISRECGIKDSRIIDETKYMENFKTGLIHIVYEWADNEKFSIFKDCGVSDGSIIRSIRRLYELINEMAEATVVIGNPKIEEKFLNAARLIKRGIAFASSLYYINE